MARHLVGVEDAVDVETRFYHASFNLDHKHDGMLYCKSCDMKYRKVKKDTRIPQEHEDLAK